MKKKHILVLAGIVGVASLVPLALAIKSVRFARWTLHRPRVVATKEDREKLVSDLTTPEGAPKVEDVTLKTSDGLALRGWYVPSKQRAAIAFVHGGKQNRAALQPEATELARRGYGVLLFDSRNSGESDGELSTWGEAEQKDVTAALDFLSARSDVDPKRIGVLGFSIGATTVALAAASDKRAAAVVLNATWTSLEDEAHDKFNRYGRLSEAAALWAFRDAGIHVERIRPVDHVGEIAPRPLFMVGGDVDDDTPVAINQRVFAAAKEPKSLWIVPGANHGECMKKAPAEYTKRLVTFFDASLLAP